MQLFYHRAIFFFFRFLVFVSIETRPFRSNELADEFADIPRRGELATEFVEIPGSVELATKFVEIPRSVESVNKRRARF